MKNIIPGKSLQPRCRDYETAAEAIIVRTDKHTCRHIGYSSIFVGHPRGLRPKANSLSFRTPLGDEALKNVEVRGFKNIHSQIQSYTCEKH